MAWQHRCRLQLVTDRRQARLAQSAYKLVRRVCAQTHFSSSGFKLDRSFYRKAMLACGGQVWHEVSFEYPTASHDDITPFVVRVAKAVQECENQGCEASESPSARNET